MKNNALVALLRDTLRRAGKGAMTGTEFACLTAMILSADPATGIWRGCASSLSSLLNYSVSERQVRRALDALKAKGFLNRFVHAGRYGNYPILLHGYPVSEGPKRGTCLNALATTDWAKPVYESADRDGG